MLTTERSMFARVFSTSRYSPGLLRRSSSFEIPSTVPAASSSKPSRSPIPSEMACEYPVSRIDFHQGSKICQRSPIGLPGFRAASISSSGMPAERRSAPG